MFYIVDIYSYYVYDEREYKITVLAMAKTEQEIIKFAKQIDQDQAFSNYFSYCHNVGVYYSKDLIPPYKFKDMKQWCSFNDIA